jgi:hypothetical protein
LFDIHVKEISKVNYNHELNEVNVSKLNNGLYILQMQTGKNTYSRKIQIQH